MSGAPRIKIGWWITGVVVLILLFSAGSIITMLTDFCWYKEIGFTSIFFKSLLAKIGCGFIGGIAAVIVLLLNFLLAKNLSKHPFIGAHIRLSQFAQTFAIAPMLGFLIPLVTLFIAFVFGSWCESQWDVWLKFAGATPFFQADPLFNKDIGFYVFSLPFYRVLYAGCSMLIFLSLAGSGVIYFVRQHIGFDGRRVILSPVAKKHLLLLTGLLIAGTFFHFQFKMYALVNGGGHIVNGAGFADIHYYIPVLKAMKFVSLIAAVLIWMNIGSARYRFVLAGIGLLFVGNVGGKAVSQMVQKFVVSPNEVVKETPYIAWSIKNTRAAYNLENIEERHFSPDNNLSPELLKQNNLTIKNIRLWDHAPLKTTYSQLQEIRTYYDFLDVDNDRYMVDGEMRQVMLSPRELLASSLPSRIWINEHLSYTHGYGLCLGPVNSVTSEGLPDFFIKNIPPEASTPITITRPEIYYGESPAGYAIVDTKSKEFDYPSGNDNVYTTYKGTGGVPMGGFFKKMLFVLRFQELKILLSSDITAHSRIMYNRQIMERAQKALPFLSYDADPYMVITKDGRLVWIIDAYTTTDAYPYSAQASDMGNYIRNSVKIVVDAYNGSLSAYIADSTDPIIATYAHIFPKVFKPFASMPADIRSHMRYPQTLFSIQARVFSLYHMNDPQVFYNKEDMWKIPDSYSEDANGPMQPYYTIMKLAEVGKQEEFILMVPFSPAKKENMIAWLAARCDEPNYGKLLVFDFPKQNLVYGPQQIESRINQDADISKQLALWNQGGSRVIRGSLLVVPVEQSLLYVQPLYIAAQSGGVPELKRVIVAYGNSIAMEENLEQSLNAIFGKSSSYAPLNNSADLQQNASAQTPLKELVSEANRQYENAQLELQRGNWAGYGAAMQKVKDLLKDLGEKVK